MKIVLRLFFFLAFLFGMLQTSSAQCYSYGQRSYRGNYYSRNFNQSYGRSFSFSARISPVYSDYGYGGTSYGYTYPQRQYYVPQQCSQENIVGPLIHYDVAPCRAPVIEPVEECAPVIRTRVVNNETRTVVNDVHFVERIHKTVIVDKYVTEHREDHREIKVAAPVRRIERPKPREGKNPVGSYEK